MQCVCDQMKTVFRVNSIDSEDVIDLDSSTEAKFSRHLIFNVKEAVFADNSHVGAFVHYLVDQIKTSTSETLKTLRVCTEKGSDSLFIDSGVYTRNRNFRILGSSKLGKTAVLKYFKPSSYKAQHLREFKSLWQDGRHKEVKRDTLFDRLLSSLVCSTQYNRGTMGKFPRLLTFENKAHVSSMSHTKPPRKEVAVSDSSRPSESFGRSPFPLLDDFMLTQMNHGGVQGCIRSVVYFSEGNTVVYNVGRNRWCWNVGRAHKSNHTILIADCKNGVFYQKCLDPECRESNYRSPEKSIPPHVNPLSLKNEDVITDEEMSRALDEASETCDLLSAFAEDVSEDDLDDDFKEVHLIRNPADYSQVEPLPWPHTADLFFAYGSNMDADLVAKRTGASSQRFLAELRDYEMTFCKLAKSPLQAEKGIGYANVRPRLGCKVYGILNACKAGLLEKIHAYQRSWSYDRQLEVDVVLPALGGRRVRAVTYAANEDTVREGLKPARDYALICLNGGRDLLPPHYLEYLEACVDESLPIDTAHDYTFI
ncbi:DNA-directed primase/polymerase protein-like isoform X2 [Oscarella lobularis]|uniref:DNA-directed primase/polymerase protein-like isoform X2 n=1 Tax=Oscarella lobularis TaxID=121494 RepID=UPI0033142D36